MAILYGKPVFFFTSEKFFFERIVNFLALDLGVCLGGYLKLGLDILTLKLHSNIEMRHSASFIKRPPPKVQCHKDI